MIRQSKGGELLAIPVGCKPATRRLEDANNTSVGVFLRHLTPCDQGERSDTRQRYDSKLWSVGNLWASLAFPLRQALDTRAMSPGASSLADW
jgi:hypothetical protein